MIDKEILRKFAETPGLCTHSEVLAVQEFIKSYTEYRDVFRCAYGIDPIMEYLESVNSTVDWYLDYSLKKTVKEIE